MPTEGEELASLNFESMIGGPLVAVVKAQTQAAMTSVDFIKAVGFKTVNGETEPIMVTFSYFRDVPNPEKPGETMPKKFELDVPILTIVPIPFLRIEETDIDFHAKIISTAFTKTDTSIGVGAELTAKGGWGPVSAQLKANFSYQRKIETGGSADRTFDMAIHVVAKQEEQPRGLDRVLTILENATKEHEPTKRVAPIVIEAAPAGVPSLTGQVKASLSEPLPLPQPTQEQPPPVVEDVISTLRKALKEVETYSSGEQQG